MWFISLCSILVLMWWLFTRPTDFVKYFLNQTWFADFSYISLIILRLASQNSWYFCYGLFVLIVVWRIKMTFCFNQEQESLHASYATDSFFLGRFMPTWVKISTLLEYSWKKKWNCLSRFNALDPLLSFSRKSMSQSDQTFLNAMVALFALFQFQQVSSHTCYAFASIFWLSMSFCFSLERY